MLVRNNTTYRPLLKMSSTVINDSLLHNYIYPQLSRSA